MSFREVHPLRAWLVTVSLALSACGPGIPADYAPAVGDVVFQSLPPGRMTTLIEGVSGSPYSHCGIVDESDGELTVIEAFQSVRAVRLEEFLERGRGGAFSVYRWKGVSADIVPELLAAVRGYAGRPYDFHYSMDDESIYCSELIWKAYRDVTGESLGETRTLGELEWQPHEQAIREMEGGRLPLYREIITPAALARAAQLEELLAHGW